MLQIWGGRYIVWNSSAGAGAGWGGLLSKLSLGSALSVTLNAASFLCYPFANLRNWIFFPRDIWRGIRQEVRHISQNRLSQWEDLEFGRYKGGCDHVYWVICMGIQSFQNFGDAFYFPLRQCNALNGNKTCKSSRTPSYWFALWEF